MLPIKIKEWQLLLLLACIQFSNILDFVIMDAIKSETDGGIQD